jgi:DNA-binding transcriptional ArsR family regulator
MTEPAPRPSQVFLDSQSVRVLAHPLRARILGLLRLDGPATATQLAPRLGTNSGTTSYHLRKLAEVGLVDDCPDEGDGRDRWWRAAHEFTSWSNADFGDDPDAKAAADWLVGYHLRTMTARGQAWLDTMHEWPQEWLQAADLSDYRLYLTADQTEALGRELHEVILRYFAAGEAARTASGAAPLEAGEVPADGASLVPVGVFVQLHPDVRP